MDQQNSPVWKAAKDSIKIKFCGGAIYSFRKAYTGKRKATMWKIDVFNKGSTMIHIEDKLGIISYMYDAG